MWKRISVNTRFAFSVLQPNQIKVVRLGRSKSDSNFIWLLSWLDALQWFQFKPVVIYSTSGHVHTWAWFFPSFKNCFFSLFHHFVHLTCNYNSTIHLSKFRKFYLSSQGTVVDFVNRYKFWLLGWSNFSSPSAWYFKHKLLFIYYMHHYTVSAHTHTNTIYLGRGCEWLNS